MWNTREMIVEEDLESRPDPQAQAPTYALKKLNWSLWRKWKAAEREDSQRPWDTSMWKTRDMIVSEDSRRRPNPQATTDALQALDWQVKWEGNSMKMLSSMIGSGKPDDAQDEPEGFCNNFKGQLPPKYSTLLLEHLGYRITQKCGVELVVLDLGVLDLGGGFYDLRDDLAYVVLKMCLMERSPLRWLKLKMLNLLKKVEVIDTCNLEVLWIAFSDEEAVSWIYKTRFSQLKRLDLEHIPAAVTPGKWSPGRHPRHTFDHLSVIREVLESVESLLWLSVVDAEYEVTWEDFTDLMKYLADKDFKLQLLELGQWRIRPRMEQGLTSLARLKLRALRLPDLKADQVEAMVLALEENHHILELTFGPLSTSSMSQALQLRLSSLLARNKKGERLWDKQELMPESSGQQGNQEQGSRRFGHSGKHELQPRSSGKVFICGNEEVGKTRLSLSLRGSRPSFMTTLSSAFCSPKELERTRGVAVTTISQDSLRLSLWDFAGQVEYRVLHSFFLPQEGPETLFLIVLSVREGEKLGSSKEDLDFWLKFVASSGKARKKARVAVVVNCFGGAHPGGGLVAAFAHVKDRFQKQLAIHSDMFQLDASQPRSELLLGLRAFLFSDLAHVLAKLEGVPRVCHLMRDAVVAMREEARQARHQKKRGTKTAALIRAFSKRHAVASKIVSWDDFLARTTAEEQIARAAVEYLHLIGEVVYFPELSLNPGAEPAVTKPSGPELSSLAGAVVVDPGWLCEQVVGEVLLPKELQTARDRRVRERGMRAEDKGVGTMGILSRAQLEGILGHALKELSLDLEALIGMLLALELCAYVGLDRQCIIIPSLLNSTKVVTDLWERSMGQGALVFGRRLQCQTLLTDVEQPLEPAEDGVLRERRVETVFPPALFQRLQARLKQKWGGESNRDSDLQLEKDLICYRLERAVVLLDFDEARYRLHVFARGTGGDNRNTLEQLEKAARDVHELAAGLLQGAFLEDYVVEPWLAGELTRSQWSDRSVLSVREMGSRVIETSECCVKWEIGMKVVDLLTMRELEGVKRQIRAKLEADTQFAETVLGSLQVEDTEGDKASAESDEDAADDTACFPGIRSLLAKIDKKIDKNHNEVMSNLNGLKEQHATILKGISDLQLGQQEMSRNLNALSQFSLSHAASSFPRFLFILDERGTLGKLRDVLLPGHELTFHFMCEAKETPHEVVGQIGVPVRVVGDLLAKIGPWLRWSLGVIGVMLKIGGAAGVAGLSAAGEALVAGATANLSILTVEGSAAKLTDYISQYSSTGSRSVGMSNCVKLAREAVTQLGWNDVTYRSAFGLCKVVFGTGSVRNGKVAWICQECLRHMEQMVEIL